MKKIIIAVLFIGFAISAGAQQYKYIIKDVLISSITVKQGQNSLLIKHGKGTLNFTIQGESISNINFKDSLGKTHSLTAMAANTPGAPKPDCDATSLTGFVSQNKDIAFFVCKKITAGRSPVTSLVITFGTQTGTDRYSIKNLKMGQ